MTSTRLLSQIKLNALPEVVRSFQQQPIYGWRFFDLEADDYETFINRPSLDVTLSQRASVHTARLFQEAFGLEQRHIDLLIWFDELGVHSEGGDSLPVEHLIAAGRDWWSAFYAGDSRTHDPVARQQINDMLRDL
jgi:hypothetical protein